MKFQSDKIKLKYDMYHDVLYIGLVKRDYMASKQIGNFIFDVDNKNKIVGFEILNASKIFSIPKINLENMVKLKLLIQVNNSMILVKSVIVSNLRNSQKISNINVERVRPQGIKESKLNVAVSKIN
tara:strand:+ start:108 stop:485 length:378 start_codon:yes stop_codon:yes gene_type:complete